MKKATLWAGFHAGEERPTSVIGTEQVSAGGHKMLLYPKFLVEKHQKEGPEQD